MKYVFGPVPSRRLGQSLGVDTVPLKTCNWNCVYCQLGRSVPLTNLRAEYVPGDTIIAELTSALASHAPGQIDWITFVASGEPTLHSGIGWLIREAKSLSMLPVAVITNGATLYMPGVRRELSAADAVLPSLDAGNPDLFRAINRPHPQATFERQLSGLRAFRKEFSGKLWVEVMLVRGMNDTETALREIAAALKSVQPDEVHIVQPTRPPAETWVEAPDEEGLLRARAILGGVARVVHPASGTFDLSGDEQLDGAVLGIITRHPMLEAELIQTLQRWSPDEVGSILQALQASGQAQVVERFGQRFWSGAPARYAEPSRER